ncbi:MAG: NADPH-dependent oxidoreductase [Paenibacillaceae bacterium]|jgi:NAD(P)H-dependent FMN reductase|nr:NADPH-dependent oxidoreductase [Paenibacillaceae bacterium]
MNVIVLAGGSRKDASTTRLAGAVAAGIKTAGHQVFMFDLYEKQLPFFDPDLDYDGHPLVNELWTRFMLAHAIVLASPEYHGAMSGRLKNALDYLALEHFDGKAVLAVATAGGSMANGALTNIQAVVRNLHGINCPEWLCVSGGERAFGTDGRLSEGKVQSRADKTTDYFLKLAGQLQSRHRG